MAELSDCVPVHGIEQLSDRFAGLVAGVCGDHPLARDAVARMEQQLRNLTFDSFGQPNKRASDNIADDFEDFVGYRGYALHRYIGTERLGGWRADVHWALGKAWIETLRSSSPTL